VVERLIAYPQGASSKLPVANACFWPGRAESARKFVAGEITFAGMRRPSFRARPAGQLMPKLSRLAAAPKPTLVIGRREPNDRLPVSPRPAQIGHNEALADVRSGRPPHEQQSFHTARSL
jgi:hypothetical protein